MWWKIGIKTNKTAMPFPSVIGRNVIQGCKTCPLSLLFYSMSSLYVGHAKALSVGHAKALSVGHAKALSVGMNVKGFYLLLYSKNLLEPYCIHS